MIYAKDPRQVLWDMVKDLSEDIPVYIETMHEDDNSIPDSYILLRSQLSDTNLIFGDGKGQVRAADCDIILVSKGYADDTTDLHNINKKKIRKHLNEQEINFQEYNLGYDENNKNTTHTFSLEVDYIG